MYKLARFDKAAMSAGIQPGKTTPNNFYIKKLFGKSVSVLIDQGFSPKISDMGKKKRKKRYPSNLSDGAWKYLKAHIPSHALGKPRTVSMRQIVNA
ncbi:MAG: transposase, partial [Methylobacter sp.]